MSSEVRIISKCPYGIWRAHTGVDPCTFLRVLVLVTTTNHQGLPAHPTPGFAFSPREEVAAVDFCSQFGEPTEQQIPHLPTTEYILSPSRHASPFNLLLTSSNNKTLAQRATPLLFKGTKQAKTKVIVKIISIPIPTHLNCPLSRNHVVSTSIHRWNNIGGWEICSTRDILNNWKPLNLRTRWCETG